VVALAPRLAEWVAAARRFYGSMGFEVEDVRLTKVLS
jgi:hypothetical protein